jgi:hypothetical protein
MSSLSRGRQFVQHVLPAVIRPLRVLWNEIIGFFFLVLAAVAIGRTIPIVREFDGEISSLFRLLLSSAFILIMSGFGIYSFWRAHKIPK